MAEFTRIAQHARLCEQAHIRRAGVASSRLGALPYFSTAINFDLEFAYEGFYACVIRGCRVHLNCSAAPERDQKAFEPAEHLDACFGVEDAEALANAFASSGAVFSVKLRSMPYGREFYVRDPDGHILGFIQPGDTPSK